ncbi:homoserine kinase [Ahrensia sp. R2A130]|uniref:homoserine kinase n=1 Tax=Ahrensia sp. R2A130 TaxID=744979 RepID=UPI0001E0D869|nr:homoserine kinase [Ahrensia sp. R2A130]EFL88889.1 homoserine kinase [Ahrensia sp. R2A130]
MAVYTQVSPEALEAHLKSYDLGDVTSFKGIAGGVENSNYLLGTSHGTYILTLYEARVSALDLPFFIGLMDHLAAAGFPCPTPIRMRNGGALGELCGRPAAIVSFLDGMEVERADVDHCHMAGATMAKLHAAGQDFKIHRTNALAPHGWPALIDGNIDHADGVEAGMQKLIKDAKAQTDVQWPTDLPAGVVHADMFKDNVFFLDGHLSGVIDFYFACNDFLAYDIAIAINAWCFDEKLEFQPELCSALVAGYESERSLTEEERKALPIFAKGAALRFLLTRLNDWLNVPKGALVIPHDPTAFSTRLKFFMNNEAVLEQATQRTLA